SRTLASGPAPRFDGWLANGRKRRVSQGQGPRYLVPVQCPPGDAANVPHSSVTSQVLSAGLAEFNKEIEPTPMHIVQHLMHRAIRPQVRLSDGVECPLGGRDDWSRRYEPHPSEQSKELDQVRRIVLLATQRVPIETSGLV